MFIWSYCVDIRIRSVSKTIKDHPPNQHLYTWYKPSPNWWFIIVTHMSDNDILVGGFNPSEKYKFVSWDDEIPNIWKVIKTMFQTTNQYKDYDDTLEIPCFNGKIHYKWPCSIAMFVYQRV